MNKFINKILIITFFKVSIAFGAPLEVDITEGRIEPLPIAITKFNYKSIKEKILSNNIFQVMSNDLTNSNLIISRLESYQRIREEVMGNPDWKKSK